MPLSDRYARTIDYLRISITDRCNLSCCYCMSTFSEYAALEREEILAYVGLRSCLFSDREIDLKTPLRNGAGPSDLVDIFRQAIETKPRGHGLGCENRHTRPGRAMNAIGG